MSAHLGEDYKPLAKKIDLNKAGAWSAVEQLEIAEFIKEVYQNLDWTGVYADTVLGTELWDKFTAMIDAATGGE